MSVRFTQLRHVAKMATRPVSLTGSLVKRPVFMGISYPHILRHLDWYKFPPCWRSLARLVVARGALLSSCLRGILQVVQKQPVGVVGAITPWNFPRFAITQCSEKPVHASVCADQCCLSELQCDAYAQDRGCASGWVHGGLQAIRPYSTVCVRAVCTRWYVTSSSSIPGIP